MQNSSHSEHTLPAPGTGSRQWFEFSTSAIAYTTLNCLFSLVGWVSCNHQEELGTASAHPVARACYLLAWAFCAGLAVLAGVTAYRSWRKLSHVPKLIEAEGRDRQEFMSLSGLFISFILGFGFILLCIPLLVLQMCLRIR